MTDGKYGKMDMAMSFKVSKAIEASGQMDGEYWTYVDGWSDEKIAKQFGLSMQAVAYRRKELFGPMRRGLGERDSALRADVDSLNVQVKALRVADFEQQKRIEALEKVVNILLSGQNVDRVTSDKLKELKNHFSGYAKPTQGI